MADFHVVRRGPVSLVARAGLASVSWGDSPFMFVLPLFLTFRENSYLSTVVRIQVDRGQTVVSTGPYHNVRHPMYSAILVFVAGTSLLLGSWYGVLSELILLILLAKRAMLEESALRAELPGYAAYMAQVKYRLIPRIW
jgi:protein-S-isoprenylcysteine O-methyltransferase Ste14